MNDGSEEGREADPADGSRQQGGGADAAAAPAHHARRGRQGPAPAATQLLHLVQHDPRKEGPGGDLQERGAAGRVVSLPRDACAILLWPCASLSHADIQLVLGTEASIGQSYITL